MNVVSRSWGITKLTFSVIGKDKEMLLFPLLGTIASLLYVVALLVPSGVLEIITGGGLVDGTVGFIHYAILFLIYLGLAFIASFFNVCVVYTTKIRFEGGDATFGQSIAFAMGKLGMIFQWSVIAATVGVLLAMLENLAEKLGGIGEIVLKIVRSLLGMMWSIITLFVIPVLVYEDISPAAAVHRSTEILKKTWGESIARSLGLGLMQFVALFCTIGLTMLLLFAMPASSITPIIAGIGAIAFVGVILTFNVANMVFNTALYVYASTGSEPEMFEAGTLANAFKVTK